jgi:hypothetical protein
MLSDYLARRDGDLDFEPAYPVVAAGMRGVERIEPDVYITDPTSVGCSDLFNAVYELLLQMIARYFAFGHETPEQRKVLAHAAVGLMFRAVKPLGFLLRPFGVWDWSSLTSSRRAGRSAVGGSFLAVPPAPGCTAARW